VRSELNKHHSKKVLTFNPPCSLTSLVKYNKHCSSHHKFKHL
jgi:hypothetical protein